MLQYKSVEVTQISKHLITAPKGRDTLQNSSWNKLSSVLKRALKNCDRVLKKKEK